MTSRMHISASFMYSYSYPRLRACEFHIIVECVVLLRIKFITPLLIPGSQVAECL